MVARKFPVLMKGLSLPVELTGSSASNDLCSSGSFNEWEGESLLAGNSPVGEKQNEAAAGAAAAAASGPPQIGKVEETTKLQVLVRTLLGRTVTLQVPLSPATPLLELHISQRVGVPVHAFYVCCEGKVWRDGMELQRGMVLQMVGRLRGGSRPAPVFVPGQRTCTACGMGWVLAK